MRSVRRKRQFYVMIGAVLLVPVFLGTAWYFSLNPFARNKTTNVVAVPHVPRIEPSLGGTNSREVTRTLEFLLGGHLGKTNFGGTMFVSYNIYLPEVLEGIEKTQYIWAVFQEYYLEQGILKEGTGVSIPMVVELSDDSQGFVPTSYQVPSSGAQYSDDIRRMFPEELWSTLFGLERGQREIVDALQKNNLLQAQAYFTLPE